jgi:hypothetical protein
MLWLSCLPANRPGWFGRTTAWGGGSGEAKIPWVVMGTFALSLFLIPLDLNQLLAPARSALGEAEYNRLYEEGKAMSTQQILELLGEQIISL